MRAARKVTYNSSSNQSPQSTSPSSSCAIRWCGINRRGILQENWTSEGREFANGTGSRSRMVCVELTQFLYAYDQIYLRIDLFIGCRFSQITSPFFISFLPLRFVNFSLKSPVSTASPITQALAHEVRMGAALSALDSTARLDKIARGIRHAE